MKPPRLDFIKFIFSLDQGWPTQIGLWAATWKICQKYWLFGPQYNKKTEEIHPKYRKIEI
jgi:hypothetical protein